MGTGARVGGDESKEGLEVREAVRGGKRSSHPKESGVIMMEGVDGGCPCENVEVIVGKKRVVVELRLEEVEQSLWAQGMVVT